MTVNKLKEWLKDKDGNRHVLHSYDGEEMSFEDIALSVEKKPKQKDLFNNEL